tara:strand:- start:553 stop:1551 length:999 start_codon:yes stop_codon:yes gene_type:complete
MTSNARELAQIPSTPSGRRNIAYNGAMQVAQRGTSETSSATSDYLVDRFRSTNSGGRSLTYSQESDAPDGFANSLKIKVASTFTTGATDLLGIGQLFEGQDLQHLKKGTSGALPVTLSFYVKSNLTGNVVVELLDRDSAFRHIEALVNISSANTWEYKTVTFAGDTSGALDDDNASSLDFHIYFGAGSNFTSGTLATSWASYVAANRAVGLSLNSNNFGSSTDNFISITGVQLEVGSVATEFEHRSFAEEFQLCERYFQYVRPAYYDGQTTNKYLGLTLSVPLRAPASATRVGNVISGAESTTSITFTSNSTYYIANNAYGVGGVYNMDAEL